VLKAAADEGHRDRFGEWVRSPAKLDTVDLRILKILRTDARQSARAIAKQIAMSPSAVSERIQRLERDGVILSYIAMFDPARLGAGMLAIVGVETDHQTPIEKILATMMDIPECERVYVVTGEWDLLLHVRVRDHHHLSEVLFNRVMKTVGYGRSETMIAMYENRFPPGVLSAPIEQQLRDADPRVRAIKSDAAAGTRLPRRKG
jgi:Lrp/AsnC family leucine-responsive transcriptional regulator